MANRTQNPESNIQTHETSREGANVFAASEMTAKKALKILEGGKSGQPVEVAGKEFENPLKAYQKLQEALAYVKTYFGRKLKINLDEISFKKFEGNIAGESTEQGVKINPIMLMHPAIRLAHVIAHELAHDKKKIMNEALVESYVHEFFGEDGTEHNYELAVDQFKEFAKKCSGKESSKKAVEKIYELYYSGKFEKIYEMFEKNYIKSLKTNEEKDEAFKKFRDVFPELNYVTKDEPAGHFGWKGLTSKEAANDNVEFEDVAKKAA
ncbi:MAG: aminopeptidase [Candidatus Peregrinibacteria bacterium]|nr:aminopeptidase [Candidatus Peregrinibacteria bacterium]